VGQRQKKRKRTKKAGIGGDESCETLSTPVAATKAESQEIVPFDFASAPNILDDVPNELGEREDGRVGKRKRPKRGTGGLLISLCAIDGSRD
jgi:hypothetical protein